MADNSLAEIQATLAALPPEPLALVHLYAAGDPPAFESYRTRARQAAASSGGRRLFDLQVEQVFAGGGLPYWRVWVDSFRSPVAAFHALEGVAPDETAVETRLVLAVQPARHLWFVRYLRWLAPVFRWHLGTGSERRGALTGEGNPEIGPTRETIAAMRAHDPTAPFYMLNLNRYYPVARYPGDGKADVSGAEAYARYGKQVAPYLISVGGYPAFSGRVLTVLTGNAEDPLYAPWDELALVYYPSRRNFLRMLTHLAAVGTPDREAGLEKAVLMVVS